MPDLSQLWIFWVTFAMLVAAGFGAPIPEELPVIGAGIWVAHSPEVGPVRWLILPVCIVGIVISDVMLYSIGRFGGARLLKHHLVARLMPPEKRARIEHNFAHYGVKILLFVRWLPGIRSPMFITAGMMRVPVGRFVLADSLAATMGHSLLFFLAFWFGDQFRDLVVHAEEQVDKVRPLLILTVLIAIPVYLLVRYLRRTVPTADPKELPLIGEKVAAGIESLESGTSLFRLHREQGSGDRTNASPVIRSQGSEIRSRSLGDRPDGSAIVKGQGSSNHNHALPEERKRVRPPSSDPGTLL